MIAHQRLQPAPPRRASQTAPGCQSSTRAITSTSNSAPNSIPKQHLQQHPKLHAPCTLPSILQECACTVTGEHPKQPNTQPRPKTPPAPAPQAACPQMCLHRHLHGWRPGVNIASCAHTVTSTPNSPPASQNTTSTSTPNCMPPCTLPSRCKNTRAPSPPKQRLCQHPQTACPLAPYLHSILKTRALTAISAPNSAPIRKNQRPKLHAP